MRRPKPCPGAPLTSVYSVQMQFRFHKTLGENLEPLKNATIHQDFDAAVLVDGKEGAGKSVFAMQIAYFLDVDHHIDLRTQVCFLPEQFKKAVKTLGKGKAIVWDEARRGGNRRRSTQDVNLEITDMLAECRQNNLFLVIVLPSFYDLDMSIAVWRTRALIHVWYEWDKPNKRLIRGFFRYYSEEAKKQLFCNKHHRMMYNYPKLPGEFFDGDFPHHYVVDQEEYRRLKSEATNKTKGFVLDKTMLVVLNRWGVLSKGWRKVVAEKVGVTERTILNWTKEEASADTYNSGEEEEEVLS